MIIPEDTQPTYGLGTGRYRYGVVVANFYPSFWMIIFGKDQQGASVLSIQFSTHKFHTFNHLDFLVCHSLDDEHKSGRRLFFLIYKEYLPKRPEFLFTMQGSKKWGNDMKQHLVQAIKKLTGASQLLKEIPKWIEIFGVFQG